MRTWLDDIEEVATEVIQIKDTFLFARKASELIDPVLFSVIGRARVLEQENADLRQRLAEQWLTNINCTKTMNDRQNRKGNI